MCSDPDAQGGGCHSTHRCLVSITTALKNTRRSQGREMMHKAAVYGTAVVVLAMAANLLHAISHVGQDVLSLEVWQWGYVVGVIFASPIVAAALLWTRYRRLGALLLLASMAGSFVFDLAYHFLIPGPDNVFTLQPGAWLIPFRVSSVMLVAVSGLGSLVGGWAVARLSCFGTGTPSTAKAVRPRHASRTNKKKGVELP
jgi:hypothetical protein